VGAGMTRINFSTERIKLNPTAPINPEKIKSKAILFLRDILDKIKDKPGRKE
jgi:hypothetical protein